jgi:hypothetical protein
MAKPGVLDLKDQQRNPYRRPAAHCNHAGSQPNKSLEKWV